MKRLSLYTLLAVASFIAVFFVTDAVLAGLLTGVVTGLIIPISDRVASNSGYIGLSLQSIRHRRRYVRVSFSYLIRIEVDGKYMLLRGRRLPNQFQPVGGVYKFNNTIRGQFKSWGVLSDNLIPVDDDSTDDLRLRIRGRHLPAFVKWFDSGRNREIGIWREFSEELIETGILSGTNFKTVRYDYIRKHNNGVKYSEHSEGPELLAAHIFDLLPTPEQLTELKLLKQGGGSTNVQWFSADQIKRKGVDPGEAYRYTVSPTAGWLLG